MIADDSIFRNLPSGLDRKQALYLDGIRHCGEMAGLAYSRLKETLTAIAQEGEISASNRTLFTSAFLDAWSLVDVIDRFRSLVSSLPNATPRRTGSGQSFAEISRPCRNLRNVADHIARRADYVVARQGTALGVLACFTACQQDPLEAFICMIVPGTLQVGSWSAVNPAGRLLEYPTGLVHLSAGEFTADISETVIQMRNRIEALERALHESIGEQAPDTGKAGSDALLRERMTFTGSDEPKTD